MILPNGSSIFVRRTHRDSEKGSETEIFGKMNAKRFTYHLSLINLDYSSGDAKKIGSRENDPRPRNNPERFERPTTIPNQFGSIRLCRNKPLVEIGSPSPCSNEIGQFPFCNGKNRVMPFPHWRKKTLYPPHPNTLDFFFSPTLYRE